MRSDRSLASLASGLLALTMLAAPLCGLAQRAEEPPLVWQSRNNTFEELTREFAELYGNILALMAHSRTVPTTTVSVPAGKTITEVLRERVLFDGKYLPKELDIVVCKMNPGVCVVQAGKSGNTFAADASASWRLKPGEPIVVPDIQFTALKVHKPYVKNAGDSLKSIVVDDRRGCEQFDDECKKYVQNLNRRLDAPLDTAYAGQIVVPTKAYRAIIRVTNAEKPATTMRFEAPAGPRITPARQGDSAADLVKMAPKLGDHVIPASKAMAHDDTAVVAMEGTRMRVLKLIRHPFSTDTALKMPPHAKASVAVFDSWVDHAHCMLSNVTVLDPDGLAGTVQRAGTCGDSGNATDASDHGTHVVGLIGMKRDAKHGPGINPYASIRALSVKYDEFVKPLYLAKQADRLRALYETDAPDVVNLSFEYSLSAQAGRNDVFRTAMKDQERETLFVVSAGNDGLNLSSTGDCRVRPACFDDKNIVTVGALDLDDEAPKLISGASGGSNYGDRVHLAAPGQNILSTLAGDRTGVMTGTSQAAPAVAGAASLLYLFEPRLRPSQVKNRLIYTSDLFPALYSKVQGGRLNVQRMLDYTTAIVDPAGGTQLRGSLRQPNKTVRFVDFKTSQLFSLTLEQVRRLKFNPKQKYYTLYYTEEAGRDSGILKRRFVTLKDPGTTLSLAVPGGPDEPDSNEDVKLKDVLDYVSALLL